MSVCEKENFVLNAKEMGMILSEVFPEKTRVQRRGNGNRTWKYPLSKKSQLDEDALKWEDLPHFTRVWVAFIYHVPHLAILRVPISLFPGA